MHPIAPGEDGYQRRPRQRPYGCEELNTRCQSNAGVWPHLIELMHSHRQAGTQLGLQHRPQVGVSAIQSDVSRPVNGDDGHPCIRMIQG